jgi:drug/metabolite transporter (DMT)-like permease
MGDDWAAQTADTIERYVGTARSKTTEPVERVARILVYGLVAAILGVATLALLMIVVIRVLDIAIPGEVWSAYFVAGGIFTFAGLLLWRKRSSPNARKK